MNDNRVLARTGARELSTEEIERVSAAQIVHTNVCTGITGIATHTGGDGDGCSDTDNSSLF